MARILSISFPKDDEHLVDALNSLPGSTSGHVVEAIRQYLQEANKEVPPFWYVAGKDYSHLPLETRMELKKFGYMDAEVQEKD